MFKKLWQKIKDTPWVQFSKYLLLFALLIGSITGIGFGINYFATDNKLGNDFGQGYETKIDVELDPKDTSASQDKKLSESADALANRLEIMGLKQIDVSYSISSYLDGSDVIPYGILSTHFEDANNIWNIDDSSSSDDTTNTLKSNQFKIYSQINRSATLQLDDYTELRKTTTGNKNFINGSKSSKDNNSLVFDDDTFYMNGIDISNPTASSAYLKFTNKQNFNLDSFFSEKKDEEAEDPTPASSPTQAQTNVLKDDANKGTKGKTDYTWVLWEDKDQFIDELNNLLLLGKLTTMYNKPSEIDQYREVQAIYNNLNPDQQKWSDKGKKAINIITQDNLMYLLNEFAKSQYVPPAPSAGLGDDTAYVDYDFLNSDSTLISGLTDGYLLKKIDYKNFEQVFENLSSDSGSDDTKPYDTNEMKYDVSAGYSAAVSTRDYLQKAHIELPIFNYKVVADDYSDNISYDWLFSNITIFDPTLSNSVTTMNAFMGTMIGVSIIVLIIGIIVSFLYRIPGFYMFLGVVFAVVMTLVAFASLNFNFTTDTLAALLIGVFLAVTPSLSLFKKFKREIISGANIKNAKKRAFNAYFKTGLDLHITSMIIALCFLYFTKEQNQGFGSMLVVTTAMSFLCSFLFQWLITFITVHLKYQSTFKIYVPKRYMKYIKDERKLFASMDANDLNNINVVEETKSKRRFNIDIFKVESIIVAVVLTIIAIVGILVITLVGPGSSPDFISNATITIHNVTSHGYDVHSDINSYVNSLASSLNISVTGYHLDGSTLVINTKNTMNAVEGFSNFQTFNSNVSGTVIKSNDFNISEASSLLPQNLAIDAIKGSFISLGFLSIYVLISLNVLSIIPIFIMGCFNVMVLVGIVGIVRMPVDINTVISCITAFTIGTIINVNVVSNIKSTWNKKQIYTGVELQQIINQNLNLNLKENSTNLFMIIMAMVVLMIFGSKDLIWFDLTILIGVVVSYLAAINLLPSFWYYFVRLRELYQTQKHASDKINKVKRKNYDKVDEQEIQGINKH